MMRYALTILALVITPIVARAQTTLTFEGIQHISPIPDGYGGLTWANLRALDPDILAPGGTPNDVVSPVNVAIALNFNPTPTSASISSATPFTLNSGYFAAVWNDGLLLSVTGYNGATQIFSEIATLNSEGPSLLTFNWANLTNVVFLASGGVENPDYVERGGGTQFVMDDLTVGGPTTTTTPEPGSLALLGTGLLGLIPIARKSLR